ncbi:VWA domain-containing protein [Caldichromatium japonicum]|uniref:VWA domain-containing protein n=1 Tax=Caldichromatium japonicum TaxID=2699430 RepID=A0A6G7VDQ1_9GAMM|nr:VWA domain-containing protein [Caldichromatium japonicum]QIK38082.1 VWA domain-containing protein [Caldichromatium japonicum]
MIGLDSPWVLLLLPLPWAWMRLLPPAQEGPGLALRFPLPPGLAIRGDERRDAERPVHRLALGISAWVALVLAATGPYWAGKPIALAVAGRDLMLVVDVSGSMEQQDYERAGRPVSRLQVVQTAAGAFIERRQGDRLGLILFGSRPYLQVPLTFDRQAVAELLQEAVVGLAGRETAIGDAIGLAVKHLRDQPPGARVLVLLTDGASNAGALTPLEAAELAAQFGVKVYTIGIGGGELGVRSPLGLRWRGMGDEFDPKTLEEIARRTGGRYFTVGSREELEGVYAELDRLEPSARASGLYRPRRSLFVWPAALALLLSALIALDVFSPISLGRAMRPLQSILRGRRLRAG